MVNNNYLHVLSVFLLFQALSCVSLDDPGDENQSRLYAVFEEDWQFQLREYPTFATGVGVADYDDRLPSITAEDEKRRAEFCRGLLQKLEAIDSSRLSEADRINYRLFRFILEDRIEQVEFEAYLTPSNGDEGFLAGLIYMPGNMPFETSKNYENYLSRLRGFPTYVDQMIALLREGLEKGKTLPKIVMGADYLTIYSAHVVDEAGQSSFFKPFQNMPAAIPSDRQEALRREGEEAVMQSVVPSFQRFTQFLADEYIPGAAEAPGISAQPDGQAFYEQRVRYFTTADLTPEEVFQTGQREVARIRAEMAGIIGEVGFQGSFADFLHFLRTDSRFYAETPRELLMEASYFSKKMDGKLPEFFGRLPRNSYGVAPVPDAIAPKYTGGRYAPGSPDGRRAGFYWVNTYNLSSRPLYVLPALTLHEAVPGHHLQISLAQELGEVPEFRKHTYLSAYGEGWALYCEYLGEEAGMYETPYQRFGRLTYEMWRACRLVVDVGLHAKGWTRDQAVEFMASRTALSLHEVNTEIDRYISWPGQALSYKIGELKIRELRMKAEETLGEEFDIREFHDLVLSQGAVPLFILEEMVEKYCRIKGDERQQ